MKAIRTIALLFLFSLTTAALPASPNLDEVKELLPAAEKGGLYIEGSRKFKLRVIRDLQRITRYRLDMQYFSGKVIIYGIGQAAGKNKFHGDKLIRGLVYSGKRIVIRYATDGNNRFVPDSHTSMIMKEPVGGTVWYHHNRKLGGRNIFNKRRRPPYIGLAHELIHAHHSCKATADMRLLAGECMIYDDVVTMEEHITRMEENKIRAELGISPRNVPLPRLECWYDEQTANDLRLLINYVCRNY